MSDALFKKLHSLPEKKQIYLYGCGKYGLAVYELLKKKHIEHKVSAFLVTNTFDIVDSCYGKDILAIDTLNDNDENAVILLTLNEEYQKAVIPILQKKGLCYYEFEETVLKCIENEVNTIDDAFFDKYSVRFSEVGIRKKILIIKLDGIGDVVLCTPFLKLLRKHFPISEVSMVVTPSTYELMSECPYIDYLYSFDPSVLLKYPLIEKADKIKKYIKSLRGSYDLAIVPRMDVDFYGASLIAYFCGASERVTYTEHATKKKELENRGYDKLFSRVIVPHGIMHESLRNINILEEIGVHLTKEEKKCRCEVWENDLSKKTISGMGPFCGNNKKHIVFGMSAADSKRVWPWELYLRLGQMILRKYPQVDIILCGKMNNNDEIEKYVRDNRINDRIFNLINMTSIGDIVSIMKMTEIYIGNDTGMMHIAAACDNKIIELSCHPRGGDKNSENSPLRFGPWMCESIVISPLEGLGECHEVCKEQYAHCIKKITVNEVFDAFDRCWKG